MVQKFPVDADSASDEPSRLYVFRFDAVEFDEAAKLLHVDGLAATVEPLPLDVLSILLRRPNEVIPHAELLRLVWRGRPTVDHVLTSAISKLRAALGASAARIVNRARVGYKFTGPVERTAIGRQPAPQLALASGQPVPERDGWRLMRRLGSGHAIEVWRAENRALLLQHVFKFASGGENLSALKHEYTVYRALRKQLGDRDDFTRVLSCNFRAAPYFIEYADGGLDLPTWGAESERLASLTLAQRIGLFLQISAAVEAAHGIGVLHKDLKPQNVLVAPAGDGAEATWLVRLTDFGNSRLLEPHRLALWGITAQGMTVSDDDRSAPGGTPMYLAPELLVGAPATTRSDLYALGVLLYQLLVGDFRRPMSNGWQRDLDDPLLIDDVTAATEGRPADRPGSVGEFASRLAALEQRHYERTAREREAAAAAETAARLLRVRQQRPWIAIAGVCLMVGIIVSLTLYAQARRAVQTAEAESHRAQSINDFLNEDVLLAADVSNLDADTPATMAQVLKHASAAAAERFKNAPLTEASVRLQLASVYQHMSDFNAAIAELDRAVELLSARVPGDDPTLIGTRLDLAKILAENAKLKEAERQLGLAEAGLKPESFSRDALLESKLVNARFSLLYMKQSYADALVPGMRMLALGHALASSTLRTQYAANQRMADLYFRLGRMPESEALLQANLQPPMSVATLGAAVYARAQIAYARTRIAEGKFDGVEPSLVDARTVLTRKLGPDDYYVAVANLQLSDLYNARAEFAKAEPALRAAYSGLVAKYGTEHQTTRITALNLAITSLNAGHSAAALDALNRQRPAFLVDAAYADNPVAQILDFNRARGLSDLGRQAEASAVLKPLNAKRLSEAEPAPDWEWRLQAEKGRAMAANGARSQGLDLLRMAIVGMNAAHSVPWVQESYRTELHRLETLAHS